MQWFQSNEPFTMLRTEYPATKYIFDRNWERKFLFYSGGYKLLAFNCHEIWICSCARMAVRGKRDFTLTSSPFITFAVKRYDWREYIKWYACVCVLCLQFEIILNNSGRLWDERLWFRLFFFLLQKSKMNAIN